MGLRISKRMRNNSKKTVNPIGKRYSNEKKHILEQLDELQDVLDGLKTDVTQIKKRPISNMVTDEL